MMEWIKRYVASCSQQTEAARVFELGKMSGPELKALVVARGFTYARFAVQVGKSRRQVHRWFRAAAVPRYVEVLAHGLPLKPPSRTGA